MLSDRRGTVANSPHLRWRDVPFGALLAARLGPRYALGVYNDVNAIIWGEAQAGAARGCRDMLGVYVGTGIGGGVIANGQLVTGTSNCAGEIGHTKVRWDRDAAPAHAASAAASRPTSAAATSSHASSARPAAAPAAIRCDTPGDVDRAAAAGDPWALALWHELAPLLVDHARQRGRRARTPSASCSAAACSRAARCSSHGHRAHRRNDERPLVGAAVRGPRRARRRRGLVGAAHLAAAGTDVLTSVSPVTV